VAAAEHDARALDDARTLAVVARGARRGAAVIVNDMSGLMIDERSRRRVRASRGARGISFDGYFGRVCLVLWLRTNYINRHSFLPHIIIIASNHFD
jgi:hypothetical protein